MVDEQLVVIKLYKTHTSKKILGSECCQNLKPRYLLWYHPKLLKEGDAKPLQKETVSGA